MAISHESCVPQSSCPFESSGADTPRIWTVWAVAFGTVCLGVAPPLWLNPRDDQSNLSLREALLSIGDDLEHSRDYAVIHGGPTGFILRPCIAAVAVAAVVDHRGRYRRKSWLHFLARAYALCIALSAVSEILRRGWYPMVWSGRNGAFVLLVFVRTAMDSIARLVMMGAVVKKLDKLGSETRILVRMIVAIAVSFFLAIGLYAASHEVEIAHEIPSLALVFFLLVFWVFAVRRLFKSMVGIGDGLEDVAQADRSLARWALSVAWTVLLAASATCSLLFCQAAIFFTRMSSEPTVFLILMWILELLQFLDSLSNTASILLLSGITGPRLRRNASVSLHHAARAVSAAREKAIRTKCLAACIASLIGGKDASTLIGQAKKRFRCVSWAVLRERREIICSEGTLDGADTSSLAWMKELAEPCQLGECDAFLSHSWHDDAQIKWAVLEAWCENFKLTHGREPTLWIDKLCIDQLDIKADLECLPVFIAGCNSFLALSGMTYTTRLWCLLELFVFTRMQEEDIGMTVRYLASDHKTLRAVRQTWLDCRAAECQCFDPKDKDKILQVISEFPGGVDKFDHDIQHLFFVRRISKAVATPLTHLSIPYKRVSNRRASSPGSSSRPGGAETSLEGSRMTVSNRQAELAAVIVASKESAAAKLSTKRKPECQQTAEGSQEDSTVTALNRQMNKESCEHAKFTAAVIASEESTAANLYTKRRLERQQTDNELCRHVDIAALGVAVDQKTEDKQFSPRGSGVFSSQQKDEETLLATEAPVNLVTEELGTESGVVKMVAKPSKKKRRKSTKCKRPSKGQRPIMIECSITD